MLGDLRVVDEPTDDLAISVESCKEHCLLETPDDIAQVTGFIQTAQTWIEAPTGWLGRSLRKQKLAYDLPNWAPSGCFEPIPLPAGPVIQVTAVKYYDTNNALQTLDPAQWFADRLGTTTASLCFAQAFSEPTLYCRPSAVSIEYFAGYETTDKIPAAIKNAMKMLVAHWYANREAVATVGELQMIPTGYQDLLTTFRLFA